MKRICRQHGISRWPSRKINKVNRSLSKLKRVIESVQGGEGTFSMTSITTTSVPVTVGSVTWAANLNRLDQHISPDNKVSEYREQIGGLVVFKAPEANEPAGTSNLSDRVARIEKQSHQETNILAADASNRSRSGCGSREESTGTPASQGSCQGNPCLRNDTSPQNVSPIDEQILKATGRSLELLSKQPREINISSTSSIPDDLVITPQEPFGGMLVEDVGSSHDLTNLCQGNIPLFEEHATEFSWTKPPFLDAIPKEVIVAAPVDEIEQFLARPDVKTITIKATYREDIIRFRLSIDSRIEKLKEEVAKRLKLELGTFDIKYLDDDHEWVLIVCDADLQECIDVSRSSGGIVIRLLVHDMMANLGSSCESSGE